MKRNSSSASEAKKMFSHILVMYPYRADARSSSFAYLALSYVDRRMLPSRVPCCKAEPSLYLLNGAPNAKDIPFEAGSKN